MNKSRAFSLVELLVVVAIIGILATIVTPNVVNYMERAKFTKTTALIDTLDMALATYKIDYQRYPPSMFNKQANLAIGPSQFYEIIAERAKSAISLQDQDLKVFESGEHYWPKAEGVLRQAGVPAQVLTAPQSTEGSEVIVDSWGQPLYYVSSEVYCPNRSCLDPQKARPFADLPIAYERETSSSGTAAIRKPKNPNTFQIISFGPDGTTLAADKFGGIGSNSWDDGRDNDKDDMIDRGDNPRTTRNDTPPEDDATNF
jgi:prepilin-type N-terminal cleavage/methylation domain-containing protein